MGTTGGRSTMTSRSPRPAGPNALAPTRLEMMLDSRIVMSAIRISLALRAITVIQFLVLKNANASAGAARQNDGRYGAKQNGRVEPERPAIDVFKIELHPLIEREVAAARNLPKASQAGLDAKSSFLPCQFHAGRITQRQGPWSHDAHVSQQHINQLRQLVDAGPPQPTTDRRHSWIVANFEYRTGLLVQVLDFAHARFGIALHRPKLEHLETPFVQAHSLLHKEDRTFRFKLDNYGDEQQHRSG